MELPRPNANPCESDLRAGRSDHHVADLVARTLPWVRRVAGRFAARDHERDDLVQECYARALRALALGVTPRDERAWIRSVAVAVAMDHLRLRYRRREIAGDDAEIGQLEDRRRRGPLAELIGAEMRSRVHELVQTLPARERRVLLLRQFEGLSTRQTAQRLESTEVAVRVLLWRARRRLAGVLRARLARD